jgi:alanine racemase
MFLMHNYHYLSSLNPQIKIAPVLKSNAYGHGITQVAKVLDGVNAPFFIVDSIYEAYELLNAGIKTKIFIMGYVDPGNLKVKKLPFSYAVYNHEQLSVINDYQKGAGVHIKFDSGMHRLGVTMEELPEFILAMKQYTNVTIEGFMSHFAESEHPKSDLTILQIANYKKGLALLKENGMEVQWKHFANSAGILNQQALELGEITNMARTGLDIYGIDPRPTTDANLKPVLRYLTKIVQIKEIAKGDQVGYNGTFTAKEAMRIALLPIGYYDGIDRRLSNKGSMVVDGMVCKIIGRVSMNITAIDVSSVRNPQIGQDVIVFSDDPNSRNSIKNAARLCETIPYDLLVHLAASTRREVL